MRVLPLWNLDYSQWNLDTANELLHLLLLYNLQYHSLLPIDIPRAHGSAARVSRPLSLFPLPPLRKRSGPQTSLFLAVLDNYNHDDYFGSGWKLYGKYV